MKKIIFTDIDGTILSHTANAVPASTIQIIHELRKQGVLVYGCTGRQKSILDQLPLEGLETDGWITMNGAYCFSGDKVIHETPLLKSDMKLLLDYLQIHPFPVQFLEADRIYLNMVNDDVKKGLAEVHTAISPFDDPMRSLEIPTYMIIPWASEELWNPIFRQFQNICTRWNEYALDCFAKECGKDNGIAAVLKYLGLSKEDAIGIGDAENDLPMFEACGTSIAMKNASMEIQAKADYVTDDIDHDGWAKGIQKYIQ